MDQWQISICKQRSFFVYGDNEVLFDTDDAIADTAKLRNYSRRHPMAFKAITEPLEYLDAFVKVGIIDKTSAKMLSIGNKLSERFTKIQDDLVRNSLNNCSRTAWTLPNYLAQIYHRSLKTSGKHSDVSSYAYTLPEITFVYEKAYVPSSILVLFSLIPNTGLLEWWPKFINRSDLVLGYESIVPTKPNMSGNILVIFVFLVVGLLFAIICMVVESWRLIIYFTAHVYSIVATKLSNILSNNNVVPMN